MKRGQSAASSGKSSPFSNRSSGTRDNDLDPSLPLSPDVEPSPSNLDVNTSATPISSGKGSDGTNYLIAKAGATALGTHILDAKRGKKWKDRIVSWQERAGLDIPSVNVAVGFLDIMGVSQILYYS